MSHQTEPPRTPAPPRYKLALLTWAGAYTVITAILALLGPFMATWPLLLRTLLLSGLMVVAMTWLVIPSLTRLFRSWLMSAPRPSARAASTMAASPHGRRESIARLQAGA